MAQRIQVRRGTQTEWLTANPIPWPGEICLESDTRRWKFGDGVTHYADLEYSQNIPAHEWDGSKIRFQNPDGSWGDWVDLAVFEADYHDYIPQEEAPSHKEGRVFYDQETGTLTAYTTSTGVKQNLGRELMERCYNDTGVRIANGTPAYVSGVNTGKPSISPADCTTYDTSRVLVMTTEGIDSGNFGECTRYGIVNDIDTSALSVGHIYLGETPGSITNDKPTGGCFVVRLGVCLVSDATNGKILFYPEVSELAVEVTDTNGFPDRSEVSLSADNATREFTIAKTGARFHYYQNGNKYDGTEDKKVVIPNTEGLHAIYFDNGVLSSLANPSTAQQDDLIRRKCSVAYAYWNATDSKFEIIEDERHGISMSPATRAYEHFVNGAQFIMGLGLGNFSVDGNGGSNAHAQFSVESGTFVDEDLPHTYPGVNSTTGLDICYAVGTNGNFRKTTLTGYSVLTDVAAGVGASGRLVYNQWTGSTWQLTPVTSGNFVLCHIFGINDFVAAGKVKAFIGQNEYSTALAARAGAATEISNIRTSLALPERIPVATVIFQTQNSYTNAVKARIISVSSGVNYVDWRTTTLQQGANPTDHQNLVNRAILGAHPFEAITAPTTQKVTPAANDLVPLYDSADGNLIKYALFSAFGGGSSPFLSQAPIDYASDTTVDLTSTAWGRVHHLKNNAAFTAGVRLPSATDADIGKFMLIRAYNNSQRVSLPSGYTMVSQRNAYDGSTVAVELNMGDWALVTYEGANKFVLTISRVHTRRRFSGANYWSGNQSLTKFDFGSMLVDNTNGDATWTFPALSPNIDDLTYRIAGQIYKRGTGTLTLAMAGAGTFILPGNTTSNTLTLKQGQSVEICFVGTTTAVVMYPRQNSEESYFTPAVSGNWLTAPTRVNSALDELAADRVKVTTFTNATLSAGKLTVTHNKNRYVLVQVYDNNNKIILPDEVLYSSANAVEIDLSSYGTISGNWQAVVM